MTSRPVRRVGAPQRPSPVRAAWAGVGRSVLQSARLLAGGRVHLPRDHVGERIRFADGGVGRVYRETVVDSPPRRDRCALLVTFRLRGVRGWGHTAFELESLLNTILFVGYPGFVSKLWVAADREGVYRGLYEWDDPRLATAYARSLWRVLALVSVRGSITYTVVPELRDGDVVGAVRARTIRSTEPEE